MGKWNSLAGRLNWAFGQRAYRFLLVSIILLYFGALASCRTMRPTTAAGIIIPTTKATEGSSVNGETSPFTRANSVHNSSNSSRNSTVGAEVYLSEITSFYETVITVLSLLIGIILSIIFIFTFHGSRRRTLDMLRELSAEEWFKYNIKNVVKEEYTHFMQKGDGAEFYEQFELLEDHGERLRFLEKEVTRESYEGIADSQGTEKEDNE